MWIRWTDEAIADLDGVTRWLTARSAAAAERITEDVLAGIELLKRFPHLGKPGRVAGTRELGIARWPYLVIYEALESNIVILRVLHNAQLWPPATS